MNFKPLHDKVLVKRVEAETKTAGGILLPDNAQEKPSQGEIVAVGTGILHDNGQTTALVVKAGDKVFFNKYSGTEIKIDGVDYLIMKESEILGILA